MIGENCTVKKENIIFLRNQNGAVAKSTFHGGSIDTIGGRVRLRRPEIYHRSVPICRKNRPLSSIQFVGGEFIGDVIDTGELFIGGVVLFLTDINDTGKNFISKFFSFIAGVVDTAEKHSFANIIEFIYFFI